MGTIKHHFSLSWAAEQYRQGVSGAALGRHFGVAGNTVLRRLRMAGYPVRAYRHDIAEEALLRLHRRGLSHGDIGEALGASATTVARRLSDMNVPSHPRLRRGPVAAALKASRQR